MEVKKLYWDRFNKNYKTKMTVWKVLCERFFQSFIGYEDKILDLGAGYCEFINNIKCKEKYAVDLNEKIKNFALPEVKVVVTNATKLTMFSSEYFDNVFMSNFLEHLFSKEILTEVILEIHRILKKNGRLILTTPVGKIAGQILEFSAFKLNLIDKKEIADHKNYFKPKEVKEMLLKAGFKGEKIKNYPFEFSLNILIIAQK